MLQPSFFKFQDEHEDPGYALRDDEVGGPGRVRTDDLFHAMQLQEQPAIGFQELTNRNIGQKRRIRRPFPANFQPKKST
jgi:hypothetical protein